MSVTAAASVTPGEGNTADYSRHDPAGAPVLKQATIILNMRTGHR